LRREIEQLMKASPNGGLRLKELEDEKNALLDYIEENIEKQHSPLDARGGLLEQVKTLTLEKSHLLQAKEDYKRRLAESEEQRRSEVSRLEEDLEEAHKLLNLRLEEYQSVNRHSMIQENTFGNILPQNGVMSPDNHMIPMP
jgi:Tfp pilus assembly PilM family ATPase